MYALFLGLLISLLNTIDALLTTLEIEKGWATEGNPVQAFWMEHLDEFWMPAKILWVSLLVTILFWHYRERAAAKVGLNLAAAAYIGTLTVHLVGLFNL